jgi:hypothetical protein
MLFHRTSFIGIDPTAGGRPFVYAALDQKRRLHALGEGNLDEVLAFVGGQQEAYVAVCAPRQPNQGLMGRPDVRASLSPPPRAGRWADYRVVEYQMRQMNIQTPRTPADPLAGQGWMRMGFEVFQRLGNLGYRLYPLGDQNLKMLEVYPHACYCAWLERVPLPKHSLEGRLQRQVVLHGLGVEVPDAMRFVKELTRQRLLDGALPIEHLHHPAELDALAAAQTAWMAANQAEMITLLGDPAEGQVVFPAAQPLDHYP